MTHVLHVQLELNLQKYEKWTPSITFIQNPPYFANVSRVQVYPISRATTTTDMKLKSRTNDPSPPLLGDFQYPARGVM